MGTSLGPVILFQGHYRALVQQMLTGLQTCQCHDAEIRYVEISVKIISYVKILQLQPPPSFLAVIIKSHEM